jgi:nitrate reductase gamma subunit
LSWSIKTIVGSTAPSVVGAAAVLVGGEKGMALLVAGFGLFWLFEHRTHADALPADYLDLRRVLTLGVCTLLILTAFAASGVVS